jgi:hypothetical protein
MARWMKFIISYCIISKTKFPWNIISISKICISINEYWIISDNFFFKLSIIISFPKSSLGHHCLRWSEITGLSENNQNFGYNTISVQYMYKTSESCIDCNSIIGFNACHLKVLPWSSMVGRNWKRETSPFYARKNVTLCNHVVYYLL